MLDGAVHFVIGALLLERLFRCRTVGGRQRIGRGDDGRGSRHRRLVGQRAGHAPGGLHAVQRFRALHAAHGGRIRRLIRRIAFRCLLFFGEIQAGRDLRAHVLRAGDRRQDIHDALHIILFDLAHIFHLRGIQHLPLAVGRGRQQIAVLIDHRHVFRSHLRHAAGD